MIEFYKYLYAGGFPLRTPYDYQKEYSRNGKASQMCPAVHLTSHLFPPEVAYVK